MLNLLEEAAAVPIDTDFESAATILDFNECPAALDIAGRADWTQIIALQAHVMITRLMAENRALQEQLYCNTCGAMPCANRAFCATCRRADRRSRHRQRPERRPTPQVVVEAVLHSVRERGTAALCEPENLARLSGCDAAAIAQIDQRMAKL